MLQDKLNTLLDKEATKRKTLQFAMNLPELNESYSYSSTHPNQVFHAASVGKLFTATLIFMAIEKDELHLARPISTQLFPEVLKGLFDYQGHDYQLEVSIRELLGHTSGINDYFESKTMDGSSFIDEVLKEPDVFWTPTALLDFTRERQEAYAKPREKFHYSDTAYVLLGLLVEKIFGMSFHKALEEYIFKPLGMKDTGLSFYSENFKQEDLAPLYINGVDVHLFTSLSCDFSGGGIYTTTADLLTFLEAFQEGKLISPSSIQEMANFDNRFHMGLHYGLGMMQVRFYEFFFLLWKFPKLQGHLGVTGAHAWYDPETKASYVLNVGNNRDMASSFRLLIKILQLVQKEKKRRR